MTVSVSVPERFRTGDALLSFGPDLRVRSWNDSLEALTGIVAEDAIGRPCWELLGGLDERGALVCHSGCSSARLACEGWPLSPRRLLVKTRTGRRWVSVSTIGVRDGDEPVVLHLLRNGEEVVEGDERERQGRAIRLTPRQREVLSLLADGLPAKVVGRRLGIAETTVRNHIRGILIQLGCHSQLQALAEARRRRLV